MEKEIRTVADVRALLNRFGTFIYTGDTLGDLELLEEELDELHQLGMIEQETWVAARRILGRGRKKVKGKDS
ncbi:YqgQ family protein [Salinithrix halophila]|uniref:YqgQ family protein n=1 Tax=Salinithrix halophila TaxID=1485204 RepID=A0ABV8JH22_9BACL